MDRIHKLMLFAMVSVSAVSLTITAVMASSWTTPNTPLYTYRMEQESSNMHFLPTSMNEFTYAAENGYILNYNVQGYVGETLSSTQTTCYNTLNCCFTKSPAITCPGTCDSTCPHTCDDPTCPDTCPVTCEDC